jgi:hypothetical protein
VEMARVIRPGGMLFADIVTERFSVQTVGNVFNAIVRIVYFTLKLKPLEGLRGARSLFRPKFYENSFAAERYIASLEHAGLRDIQLRGNRPFPGLTLPGFVERVYVLLMRGLMPFWRRFDGSSSAFSRVFGAGWWAWGQKKS